MCCLQSAFEKENATNITGRYVAQWQSKQRKNFYAIAPAAPASFTGVSKMLCPDIQMWGSNWSPTHCCGSSLLHCPFQPQLGAPFVVALGNVPTSIGTRKSTAREARRGTGWTSLHGHSNSCEPTRKLRLWCTPLQQTRTYGGRSQRLPPGLEKRFFSAPFAKNMQNLPSSTGQHSSPIQCKSWAYKSCTSWGSSLTHSQQAPKEYSQTRCTRMVQDENGKEGQLKRTGNGTDQSLKRTSSARRNRTEDIMQEVVDEKYQKRSGCAKSTDFTVEQRWCDRIYGPKSSHKMIATEGTQEWSSTTDCTRKNNVPWDVEIPKKNWGQVDKGSKKKLAHGSKKEEIVWNRWMPKREIAHGRTKDTR